MKINTQTIFLVEHVAEWNDAILSILHELKFENIQIFNSSHTAFDAFVKKQPDLIICDWYTGKSNSLDFLKKVRNHSVAPDTPFIMVSGIIEGIMIKQAVAIGVNEYIVKPFNTKIFKDKIEHALNFGRLGKTKKAKSEYFKTKIAVCNQKGSILRVIEDSFENNQYEVFQDLKTTIEQAKTDKFLDILIIDEHTIYTHSETHKSLLKLIATGQIEVVIIRNIDINKEVYSTLKAIGFKHFVYPYIDSQDIKTKVDLLIELKKALLQTKDTVKQTTIEKDNELQQQLLQSIKLESNNIGKLGEKIISSSKKSSFINQLAQEISDNSKSINSITEAIASTTMNIKELQQSSKEKISISELFNNTNKVFAHSLKQRKLTINFSSRECKYLKANPTLFSSLFMFIIKALIKDVMFESTLYINVSEENNNQFMEMEIVASMTGYPHLEDIMERVWFNKDGEIQFELKNTIKELCDSQLTKYEFRLDQRNGLFTVALIVPKDT